MIKYIVCVLLLVGCTIPTVTETPAPTVQPTVTPTPVYGWQRYAMCLNSRQPGREQFIPCVAENVVSVGEVICLQWATDLILTPHEYTRYFDRGRFTLCMAQQHPQYR